jgi:AraC family transcriptional regulator
MEERAGEMVRILSEETIQSVLATQPVRTSRRLNWPGVEVHHYRLTNPQSAESSIPYIGVFLPHPDQPCRAEMTIGGEVLTALLDNNRVSIIPAGQTRTVRRDSRAPLEFTAIFLDPWTLTRIARAETGFDFPEIIPQFGIIDPLIRSIGMMLDAELASEHPRPRIYAESLVGALAAQIFANYVKPVDDAHRRSANRPELRRSIEFINQNLNKQGLRLSDLAAAANMSKYHFAKSFRQVIGIPPHQYLVRMRLEKARKLLSDRAMSLDEVAFNVGYADKRQFSEQFLKVFGVSPKRYRDAG